MEARLSAKGLKPQVQNPNNYPPTSRLRRTRIRNKLVWRQSRFKILMFKSSKLSEWEWQFNQSPINQITNYQSTNIVKDKSCQNCIYAHQPRGVTGTESLLEPILITLWLRPAASVVACVRLHRQCWTLSVSPSLSTIDSLGLWPTSGYQDRL